MDSEKNSFSTAGKSKDLLTSVYHRKIQIDFDNMRTWARRRARSYDRVTETEIHDDLVFPVLISFLLSGISNRVKQNSKFQTTNIISPKWDSQRYPILSDACHSYVEAQREGEKKNTTYCEYMERA